MSICTEEIVVRCDHPGCMRKIHADDVDQARAGFPDWLIRFIALEGPFPQPEDWCPDHGRCNWCHERKPRKSMTDGTGACEGQLICTDCVLKREA